MLYGILQIIVNLTQFYLNERYYNTISQLRIQQAEHSLSVWLPVEEFHNKEHTVRLKENDILTPVVLEWTMASLKCIVQVNIPSYDEFLPSHEHSY